MATLNQSHDLSPTPSQPLVKKCYEKPILEVIGDIRSIALGFSGGTGESGHPTTKKKSKI